MQGKIVKGIAGFYYVHVVESGVYECKAKGIFRKDKKKPLVGDDVEIEVLSEVEKTGSIINIFERKNELIRPAVANINQALVVFAAAKPSPHFNLLDRFLVMMDYQNVPVIVCFNKVELVDEKEQERLRSIYEKCGCRVLFMSIYENKGVDELKKLLHDKTTILAGPSGVGKSSFTNILLESDTMETGGISRIGRGRHTTRHSEIFNMYGKSYICDTPGFTSLMLPELEKEDLRYYFPDFEEFEGKCRFNGCVHVNEPGCAVKMAVDEGILSKDRYQSYVTLYEELKNKKKY